MSFGGPPVTVETIEEADELLRKDERDSTIGKQLFDLHITHTHTHYFFFLIHPLLYIKNVIG